MVVIEGGNRRWLFMETPGVAVCWTWWARWLLCACHTLPDFFKKGIEYWYLHLMAPLNLFLHFTLMHGSSELKNMIQGLSGKESTCPCRRHGFDP